MEPQTEQHRETVPSQSTRAPSDPSATVTLPLPEYDKLRSAAADQSHKLGRAASFATLLLGNVLSRHGYVFSILREGAPNLLRVRGPRGELMLHLFATGNKAPGFRLTENNGTLLPTKSASWAAHRENVPQDVFVSALLSTLPLYIGDPAKKKAKAAKPRWRAPKTTKATAPAKFAAAKKAAAKLTKLAPEVKAARKSARPSRAHKKGGKKK